MILHLLSLKRRCKMIKSLVNRFIKIFRKGSFEDSTIEIISYQLKKEYKVNERKTLFQ